MVFLPGLVVGLLSLLGLFITLGLVVAVRAWLRPLLTGLADLLGHIPVVGGYLSSAVMTVERTVVGWLSSAAIHTEQIAVDFFHGLVTVVSWLGREIEGLALDVYSAVQGFILHTVPSLIRAAVGGIMRAVHAIEHRIQQAEHFVVREFNAVKHRILQAEQAIGRIEHRVIGSIERELTSVAHAIRNEVEHLFHSFTHLISVIGYRIGRAEHELWNAVWPEIRRIAHDLNPVTISEWVIHHVWGLVPHEVRIFLEWVWSLIVDGAEFLVSVIEGKWPEPITHEKGKMFLRELHQDMQGVKNDLRSHL